MHDSSLALATRLFMAMACCRHCYCYYLQYGAAASPLLSVLPFPLWPLSSFSLSFSPLLFCGLCSRFDDTSDSDRRFHHLIGGRGRHLPWPSPSTLLAACSLAWALFTVPQSVATTSILRLLPRPPTPDPEALTTAAAPADICLPGRRRGERLRCWIRVYLPPHYLPLLLEPAWLSQRCWLLLRPLALPLLCSALRVVSSAQIDCSRGTHDAACLLRLITLSRFLLSLPETEPLHQAQILDLDPFVGYSEFQNLTRACSSRFRDGRGEA